MQDGCRHKAQIELIRKNCGEYNYRAQLDAINTLIRFEPDDGERFCLEETRDVISMKLEKQECLSLKVLQQEQEKLETYSSDIWVDSKQYVHDLTIETDDGPITIKPTQKNLLCKDAIQLCLITGKTFTSLTSDQKKAIGLTYNVSETVVTTTLSKIVNDEEGRLQYNEKRYYIHYLKSLGHKEDALEKFPFLSLSYDSSSLMK